MERESKAIYLERKNGWFWVVPEGQRALYFGPYRDQKTAELQGPKDDTADKQPLNR